MIQENISFIKKMIEQKRDLYAIFSFLSESLDIMRTHLQGVDDYSASTQKLLHKFVEELSQLDESLDSEK